MVLLGHDSGVTNVNPLITPRWTGGWHTDANVVLDWKRRGVFAVLRQAMSNCDKYLPTMELRHDWGRVVSLRGMTNLSASGRKEAVGETRGGRL